jgi:hypothetical protein
MARERRKTACFAANERRVFAAEPGARQNVSSTTATETREKERGGKKQKKGQI